MSLRQRIADAVYSRLPRARWLRAELDFCNREREAERAFFTAQLTSYALQHRNFTKTPAIPAITKAPTKYHDEALVSRISRAYVAAIQTNVGSRDSFWLNDYDRRKFVEHSALLEGDISTIQEFLRNPRTSMLFYGFDHLNSEESDNRPAAYYNWVAHWTYDNLLRLAEALGARRLYYPESGQAADMPDTDELILTVEAALGFTIQFPNPFPGEKGILTSRGIAGYRSVQALYQAWRIAELTKGTKSPRVVEIGAGLGRTAYYANKLGIVDYTIVDIPLTNVAQSYFLGTALGELAVRLYGEGTGDLKIIPPEEFLKSAKTYDLILNVDSLPEMALDTAEMYARHIEQCAPIFLSINHEFNHFTVAQLFPNKISRRSRVPYWLRRGYAEEIYSFL